MDTRMCVVVMLDLERFLLDGNVPVPRRGGSSLEGWSGDEITPETNHNLIICHEHRQIWLDHASLRPSLSGIFFIRPVPLPREEALQDSNWKNVYLFHSNHVLMNRGLCLVYLELGGIHDISLCVGHAWESFSS